MNPTEISIDVKATTAFNVLLPALTAFRRQVLDLAGLCKSKAESYPRGPQKRYLDRTSAKLNDLLYKTEFLDEKQQYKTLFLDDAAKFTAGFFGFLPEIHEYLKEISERTPEKKLRDRDTEDIQYKTLLTLMAFEEKMYTQKNIQHARDLEKYLHFLEGREKSRGK